MARPLDGPDDPAALPYAERGQRFQAGNPWRFREGTRVQGLEPQISEVVKTPVPPAARTTSAVPKTSRAQRTITDYVTGTSDMTAGDDPLPFSLPAFDMVCTVCRDSGLKNDRGRYNRAGIHVKVRNSHTGDLLLDGNFCKSHYLKVLELWSQRRPEHAFRFNMDLKPGI